MTQGEHERGKVGIDHQPEAAQTPSSTLAPAVAEVRAILARGRPEPHVIAMSIERDASARNQILTLLHQALGNSFVHQVVAALESPRGTSAPVETPMATTPSIQVPGPVRVVAADGLRVRSSPSHGDNVIGLLPADHRVEGLSRAGEWLAIQFQGVSAFIHAGFVEPISGQASVAASATAPPTEGATPSLPKATAPTVAAPAEDSANQASAAPQVTTEHSDSTVASGDHEPNTKHAGKNEFETANHNVIAKTTKDEADVMRDIRRSPRRFDPAWMIVAQGNLGVVDATGAMNTETLRATRAKAGNPKLGAQAMLDNTKLLAQLAPGEPFFAGTETGEHERKSPTPGSESNKDKTAQELGYADFAEYRATWGEEPVTFVGHDFRTSAHPYLRARLKVAEAYLRQRIKGPSGEKLNDKQITKQLGWGQHGASAGNASYDHNPNDPKTHQHAMGLAIDIEPSQNAYMFEAASGWVSYFEQLSVYAHQMFGGEILHPKTLLEWSQQLSTEELYQRVQSASASFAQLLTYSRKLNGKQDDPELLEKLGTMGYRGADATKAAHEIALADKNFHLQEGRRNAGGPMNLNEEMVIALRDVAGLAWGGAEIAPAENGDMMHFDCRTTAFGNSVYEAGRKHKPKQ